MLLKENSIRVDIKFYKNGKKYPTYIFKCKKCVNEISVRTSKFKEHSGLCISCSSKKEPYKHIYNELIRRRNFNYEVSITFEEFLDIIKEEKCHYCDRELHYAKHSSDNNIKFSKAHQLDRKDNTRGYEYNNLIPCCWECNRVKSDTFTYKEFIKLSPILKEIRLNRENE